MLEPTLTYAILGVWSWSLLQFCFVLGAAGAGGGEQGRRRKKSAAREEKEEKEGCRESQTDSVKFNFLPADF